jgi:hypothetical protein
MQLCEIIYVKRKEGSGWTWRPIRSEAGAKPEASEQTYELFYECVAAAQARGYKPDMELKCC